MIAGKQNILTSLNRVSSLVKYPVRSVVIPSATFLEKEEVLSRVSNVVHSLQYSPSAVAPEKLFVSELKFDSQIRRDLTKLLAEEFCVAMPDDVAGSIISIQSAVDYFSSHPKAPLYVRKWKLDIEDDDEIDVVYYMADEMDPNQ
eukprot:gene34695-44875_t